MIEVLKEKNIKNIVNIWDENSQHLTSDGKTHTLDSLTNWYLSKHHENQDYGFFHNNKIIGFCINKRRS